MTKLYLQIHYIHLKHHTCSKKAMALHKIIVWISSAQGTSVWLKGFDTTYCAFLHKPVCPPTLQGTWWDNSRKGEKSTQTILPLQPFWVQITHFHWVIFACLHVLSTLLETKSQDHLTTILRWTSGNAIIYYTFWKRWTVIAHVIMQLPFQTSKSGLSTLIHMHRCKGPRQHRPIHYGRNDHSSKVPKRLAVDNGILKGRCGDGPGH